MRIERKVVEDLREVLFEWLAYDDAVIRVHLVCVRVLTRPSRRHRKWEQEYRWDRIPYLGRVTQGAPSRVLPTRALIDDVLAQVRASVRCDDAASDDEGRTET